jgi:hypothetical protein
MRALLVVKRMVPQQAIVSQAVSTLWSVDAEVEME